MLTKENVKTLSQEQLIETLKEKSKELHGLIELINNDTDFECYGVSAFGVEDSEHEVSGGGSIIGNTLNIANLMNSSDELNEVVTAAFLIELGILEEEDDE